MELSKVIDFWNDDNPTKERKIENIFSNIIGENVIVKLYVLDPRINHFYCYADINDEQINKILQEFPNAEKIDEGRLFNKYKVIRQYGKIGFSIYILKKSKINKLIEKHKKKYIKEREKANKILF